MGAARRWDLEGEDAPGAEEWAAPSEPACDGCPGGWYRSRFVESLLRYRRRSADGGARVANLMLERCDDDLIIEAAEMLERFEDEWRNEYLARMKPEGPDV